MVPRGYYLGSWVLTVTLLTFPIGNDLHSDVNSDHGDPNGIPWAKCNGIKATNVCLVFVKICENGHQRAPKKTKGMIFSWIGRQGRRAGGVGGLLTYPKICRKPILICKHYYTCTSILVVRATGLLGLHPIR